MEKILDNKYYDLIISNSVVPQHNTGDNVTLLNEMHSLLHIRKEEVEACDLGENAYHYFPALYTLESSISVEKSGVPFVQGDPGLALFGRGIIIGIVDTGIDYLHPAFMHHDRTTRILAIWDQTKEGSVPPRGFTFGAEYTRELINFALMSEDPLSIVPSVDEHLHGTAISSIVAGRPNAENAFSGVVPDADLLVVKLKQAKDNLKRLFSVPEGALCYQESDIILGIRYLITTAKRINRPIIICLAMGSSQGGHDGRGASSMYLDYLVQQPMTGIVVSAGNEGNNLRHYYGRIERAPYMGSFQLKVGSYDKKFFMEIWPYLPSRLSIEITTPGRETSQIIYPLFGACQRVVFQSSQTIVWVNNINFEEETGDQLILLRFENTDPGIWQFRVSSDDREPFSFHSWLPSGNLLTNETFFLNADANTTITAQGDAMHPLTVTAYNQLNDTIIPESSRGYTRLGQIKPDIGAPGYQLSCALPGNLYGTITGTGAAAAHAAGIAAMVIEWSYSKGNFTSITGNQINRVIVRGAQRDSPEYYPNNIWGYGRIDAERIFAQLSEMRI